MFKIKAKLYTTLSVLDNSYVLREHGHLRQYSSQYTGLSLRGASLFPLRVVFSSFDLISRCDKYKNFP